MSLCVFFLFFLLFFIYIENLSEVYFVTRGVFFKYMIVVNCLISLPFFWYEARRRIPGRRRRRRWRRGVKLGKSRGKRTALRLLFGRQKDEERHLFRVLLSLASLARFSVACFLFFTRSVALLCESGNLRRPEKGRKGKVFFFWW